jgi:hypothetical protein
LLDDRFDVDEQQQPALARAEAASQFLREAGAIELCHEM